jgi:hypothetical protein
MMIVGCDFHPSFLQITVLDTDSGEMREHKLMHASGESEQSYRHLECHRWWAWNQSATASVYPVA